MARLATQGDGGPIPPKFFIMLEAYLTIFYTTCVGLVGLLVPIIGLKILFQFISDLLFKE